MTKEKKVVDVLVFEDTTIYTMYVNYLCKELERLGYKDFNLPFKMRTGIANAWYEQKRRKFLITVFKCKMVSLTKRHNIGLRRRSA